MRSLAVIFIATCLLLLPGCGSLLASMQVGEISDHPKQRTLGQVIEDDNIETKATVNIHAQNQAFHDAHLVVVSYGGYVLLAGQVPSEALKEAATAVVRKIKGVRRIYNELEIGPPTTGLTRTNDAWITTKIKSGLLTNSGVGEASVKVVTENGVVYLMGLATQKEADAVSHEASGVTGVRTVVKLFEILK